MGVVGTSGLTLTINFWHNVQQNSKQIAVIRMWPCTATFAANKVLAAEIWPV